MDVPARRKSPGPKAPDRRINEVREDEAAVREAPVRAIDPRPGPGRQQNKVSARHGLSVRRETQIARDHLVAPGMTVIAIEMTATVEVGPPAQDERERQG